MSNWCTGRRYDLLSSLQTSRPGYNSRKISGSIGMVDLMLIFCGECVGGSVLLSVTRIAPFINLSRVGTLTSGTNRTLTALRTNGNTNGSFLN